LLDVTTQVINPQLDMLHSCAHVN
ncbi:lipid A phosphoethanolamine transferase, partial [Acinetobacter baumannii]